MNVAKTVYSELEDIYEVLNRIPCLADLNKDTLLKMIDKFNLTDFPAEERIFNKGDLMQDFLIVRQGRVKVHDIGCGEGHSEYVDYLLRPGDSIGEHALLFPEYLNCNITAATNCTLLSLSRKNLEKTLGTMAELIDRAVDRNFTVNKNTLLGVPLLANAKLETCYVTRLANFFEQQSFQEGELFVGEGEPTPEQGIYIIQRGKVIVSQEDAILYVLTSGDYFGDESFHNDEGSPSEHTIFFEELTVCAVLTKSSMLRAMGSISRLDRPMELEHFDIVRTISRNSNFSEVHVVNHRLENKPYALKAITKRHIIKQKRVDNIYREKNVLTKIYHPFLCNLITTMRGDTNIYLLFEFLPGGELSRFIGSGMKPADRVALARFYAACVLEGLSYLHGHNICHRNLTSENVVIDRDGYAVLINFSLAKIVFDKTLTFCGTPEYLAPEIILSKGYGKEVDFWSLGILIYEMLLGKHPFHKPGLSQSALFERIVKCKYSFTSKDVLKEEDYQDAAARDLVGGLLSDRGIRIGCGEHGIAEISYHDWFENFDFDGLLNKSFGTGDELQAGLDTGVYWKPNLMDEFDVQYFDTSHVGRHGGSVMGQTRKSSLSCAEQERFDAF